MLQSDLDVLTLRSKEWDIKFNIDNRKILIVTNKKNIFQCKIDSVGLNPVQDEKYLEVMINSKFLWLSHAIMISNHANYKRHFLQRNLKTLRKITVLL